MMPDGTVPKAGAYVGPGGVVRYMRDGVHMVRVGTKAAGRTLDGRTHDDMPATPATA